MKNLILIFLLSFSFLTLFSQQEKDELKKMHAVYTSAGTFSMEINMNLFTTLSDVQPKQTANGKVYKNKDEYYSEMLGRITLVNNHCCLLIDKTQKLMIYSEPSKGKTDKSLAEDSPVPDSSIFKNAKLHFLSQTSQLHVIELKYDHDAMYDKIEISIDPTTNYLTKVVYYYAKIKGKAPAYAKTEINYTNIKLGEQIDNTVFSEKKFISVSKDKITPLSIYGSYEVIDQRRYNEYATKPH
jgi:hypothetical protein